MTTKMNEYSKTEHKDSKVKVEGRGCIEAVSGGLVVSGYNVRQCRVGVCDGLTGGGSYNNTPTRLYTF